MRKCQAFSGPLRAHESAQQADASHPNPTTVREKPQSEAGGWCGVGLERWTGGELLQLLQSGVLEHQEFRGPLQELGESGKRLCCVQHTPTPENCL